MVDEKRASIAGRIKEKLIRSKEQWAKDGRLLTGDTDPNMENRLPPGQRLVSNWPVLDLGLQPEVPKEAWQLTIDGAVNSPRGLTYKDLLAQPLVKMTSDIHCVTAWSRFDNDWEGVSSAQILSLAHPKPEAKHVIFHGYDGYTTNVALSVFADEDVLLAHTWDGRPLTREHGGPVRVVIPKWYFWKSAKWIKRIEFSADGQPGFWEERGYHNEGDPWSEQRYS